MRNRICFMVVYFGLMINIGFVTAKRTSSFGNANSKSDMNAVLVSPISVKSSNAPIFRQVQNSAIVYFCGKLVETLVVICLKKLNLYPFRGDKNGDHFEATNASASEIWRAKIETEQEELWRITHQVYSELSSRMNSTEFAIENDIREPHANDEILERIRALEENIARTSKVSSLSEPDNSFVELRSRLAATERKLTDLQEYIPKIIDAHDDAVLAKISKYAAEVKELLSNRKRYEAGYKKSLSKIQKKADVSSIASRTGNR